MSTQNQATANARRGGIGFFGLLTILFVGLKLTHNIDWSWWWVLAPLWLPAAVGLSILIVATIIMVLFDR